MLKPGLLREKDQRVHATVKLTTHHKAQSHAESFQIAHSCFSMCVFYIIYIFVIYIIDIYIIYIFIIYIYLSTPPESCEKHLTLERKKKKPGNSIGRRKFQKTY